MWCVFVISGMSKLWMCWLFSWWGKRKSSYKMLQKLDQLFNVVRQIDLRMRLYQRETKETQCNVDTLTDTGLSGDGWPPTCRVTIYPPGAAQCYKLPGRPITHITAAITTAAGAYLSLHLPAVTRTWQLKWIFLMGARYALTNPLILSIDITTWPILPLSVSLIFFPGF